MSRAAPALFSLLLFSGGCASTVETPKSDGEVAILQRINDTAQRCWMKSGDPAFRPYRVVPELDTRPGKPRILVLRAGKASGLPELVIEVGQRQLDAYGPLQNTGLAKRINGDIVRWGNGNTAC